MKMRSAFLAAVTDAPEDDAPRLIFADWLDDNGDSVRAEFIRLQCRLARMDYFDPERLPLVQRETQLLKQHARRWLRADGVSQLLGSFAEEHWESDVQFRRGFVACVRFRSPSQCLAIADRLAQFVPLEELRLSSPYTFSDAERSSAQSTFVQKWHAAGNLGLPPVEHRSAPAEYPEPEEFRRLLRCPFFSKLRGFQLRTRFSDCRHLDILLTSAVAPRLRDLDLGSNPALYGMDWEPLAAASLPCLESLILTDSKLGPTGMRAFLGSNGLPGLKRLGWGWKGPETLGLGAELCHSMATTHNWPRLEWLSLRGQGCGAEGLAALAGWPGLTSLTRLNLSCNLGDPTDDGESAYANALSRLLSSPHWGNLRDLCLTDTLYSLGALEAFLACPRLSTLRILALETVFYLDSQENPVQDEAARMLASCPHFSPELVLHFSKMGLSNEGAQLLQDRFGDNLFLTSEDERSEYRFWPESD